MYIYIYIYIATAEPRGRAARAFRAPAARAVHRRIYLSTLKILRFFTEIQHLNFLMWSSLMWKAGLYYLSLSLSLCIHIYIYMYVYVFMYVCVYIYIYMFLFIYLYICIYVYMCICMCIYIYIYTYRRSCLALSGPRCADMCEDNIYVIEMVYVPAQKKYVPLRTCLLII